MVRNGAWIRRETRELTRHVVDVTATAIVVYDRTNGQSIFDQRQIEHRADRRVGIAMRSRTIGSLDITLRDIQLRFVCDVTDCARLGAAPEQCALRAFEH